MRLLVIPNDPISAYHRGSEREFLAEFNPNGLFAEVLLLNWKEAAPDEFAGVRSLPFLDSQEEAWAMLRRLTSGELPFQAPLFRKIFAGSLPGIEEIVKNFRPTVIRAMNTHFAAELGILVKEICGMPLVISAHDPSRLTSAVIAADLLICESVELKELCSNRFEVPDDRMKVIYSGIDLEQFSKRSPSKFALDIPSELLDAPYRVLSVSRLVPGKNIETLLRALSLIKERFPGLAHIHLGSGSEDRLAHIEAVRTEQGLQGVSHFLGVRRREVLPSFYSWAQVFVLPTLWEGLSRVMREALACGTPVVGPNSGSSTEIVKDWINGILIDPHDPEAIARGISVLFDDPALRMRLSESAADSVQIYDLRSSESQFARAYNELTATL